MNGSGLGVLLGAESLLGRRSGVGRMTLQIAQELGRTEGIAGFELMLRGQRAGPDLLTAPEEAESPAASPARLRRWATTLLANAPVLPDVRARTTRRLMNRAAAALAARIGGPVVYHEPNMIAQPFDGVTVITVNDLSWRLPDRVHPRSRLAWIERRLPQSLAQARRVVAISAFTAGEIVAQLGVPADRIDIVPLAPSDMFHPLAPDDPAAAAVLARYGLTGGCYILSVSTLEPRKNHARLLQAFCRLPLAVRTALPHAKAGGKGWGGALAGAQARAALADGQLKLLGHVPDPDLVALYGGAAVFAYPSLYEGFGLPILEAMACGVPVLTSATTASAETAGDAALLVDPLDTAAIADGLARLLQDRSHAATLAEAGRRHAACFTWPNTVGALLRSWQRATEGA